MIFSAEITTSKFSLISEIKETISKESNIPSSIRLSQVSKSTSGCMSDKISNNTSISSFIIRYGTGLFSFHFSIQPIIIITDIHFGKYGQMVLFPPINFTAITGKVFYYYSKRNTVAYQGMHPVSLSPNINLPCSFK